MGKAHLLDGYQSACGLSASRPGVRILYLNEFIQEDDANRCKRCHKLADVRLEERQAKAEKIFRIPELKNQSEIILYWIFKTRELCGRWQQYADLVEFNKAFEVMYKDILPEKEAEIARDVYEKYVPEADDYFRFFDEIGILGYGKVVGLEHIFFINDLEAVDAVHKYRTLLDIEEKIKKTEERMRRMEKEQASREKAIKAKETSEKQKAEKQAKIDTTRIQLKTVIDSAKLMGIPREDAIKNFAKQQGLELADVQKMAEGIEKS